KAKMSYKRSSPRYGLRNFRRRFSSSISATKRSRSTFSFHHRMEALELLSFSLGVSRPEPCDSAGQMAFPGNRTLLWQHTVKYPAIQQENEDSHKCGTPAFEKKSGCDQEGCYAKNNGASANMDGIATTD